MRKINATQLKFILAGLMVLDHLSHVPGLIPPMWEGILHAITRCVAVGFAYLAVEGFLHTGNLERYLKRLWGAAGLMFVGNSLLRVLLPSPVVQLNHNIFLTLALGVTLLALIAPRQGLFQQDIKQGWGIAALLFLVGMLFTEGGLVVLPFMLITYLTRQRQGLRLLSYLSLSLLLFFLSYEPYGNWQETLQMLLYNSDWLFITVLPLLAVYNGQPGSRTAFNRWFFYTFYPVHLWILAIMAYITTLG